MLWPKEDLTFGESGGSQVSPVLLSCFSNLSSARSQCESQYPECPFAKRLSPHEEDVLHVKSNLQTIVAWEYIGSGAEAAKSEAPPSVNTYHELP